DGDGFGGNGPIIDGPPTQKRIELIGDGIFPERFIMRPQALATGDWNGDGVPDYVFGFEGGMGQEEEFEFGGIIAHLGKGDGGTGAVDFPRFQDVFDVTKIVIADFDGDNDPDILFATDSQGEVQILFSDGENGSRRVDFKDPVQVPFGRAPIDVATGDFDRDGDVDFAQVTAENGNSLSVWLNNGVGRSYKKLGNVPLSGRPLRVVSHDGNRDGALDLYVLLAGEAGTVGRIAYFEGQRDGSFALRKETITSGISDDLGELKFADIDRDGDPDAIATIPGANVIQVYKNQNGLLLDGSPSDRLNVAADPIDFELFDFNKDARLDLIVLGRSSSILQSFVGAGTGNFNVWSSVTINGEFGIPGSMSLGDVFADGSREVVVSASDVGNLGAFTVATDGTFSEEGSLALPGPLERIQLADLNRDGVTELVGTTQMGGLVVIFDTSNNNGESSNQPLPGSLPQAFFTTGGSLPGTGGFAQIFVQPIAPSNNPIRFVLSDVDGDGDMDAVIASEGSGTAQINIGR
ncbi:MAG: VCBS repeat-containing protein, partial [Planctomycetota bacterium]|nr:VCBS repeat-containing protein [Planctomycetota bacterium]